MVILGFLLIAAAAAAATILIVQNTGRMSVHALGHSWTVSASWLVVAGLVLLAVAVVGVAAVRHSGIRRVKKERVGIVEQNRELIDEPGVPVGHRAAEQAAPTATPRRPFHRHRPAL